MEIDRPIKKVSIQDLEVALSKFLSEMVGVEYDVTVTRLDLEPTPEAWIYDECLLNLRIRSPVENLLSEDKATQ